MDQIHNKKMLYAVLVAMTIIVAMAFPIGANTTGTASTVTAQRSPTDPTVSPTLKIYLLCPETNQLRQQWAQLVANNLKESGIQAELVIANWSTIYNRALYPQDQSIIGNTYENGGFDALFVGYFLNSNPDTYPYSHSSQSPPYSVYGLNYYLWNNTLSDQLSASMISETNETNLIQEAKQWQALAYDELPTITILYPKELVVAAPGLNPLPFQTDHDPRWPAIEEWSFTSNPQTSVTLAQPIPPEYSGFSALHAWSGHNAQSVYGPIFGGLGGSGLMASSSSPLWSMRPYMANNYSVSSDGLHWTFSIKPGIQFHNGEELDARDVVYTIRYLLTMEWWSPAQPYYANILGSPANVYWAGETGTAGQSLPTNLYEVHFDLPTPYAFFKSDVAGLPIYPASVLVNSSSGIPDYGEWTPDPINTPMFASTSFNSGTDIPYNYYGKNGTLLTGIGPIGAGPYKWAGLDMNTDTCHLTKFDGFFNKAALESSGKFGITDYYVTFISDASAAIAALKYNAVQVLDSQYHIENIIGELNSSWSQTISYDSLTAQELGFNMRHPIFGTGLGTPLGQSDPSRAAEAAKHVRRAIEYLVPKDYIIKNITHGYATYGITTPIPRGNPVYFDNDIIPRNETIDNAKLLAMNELRAAGYTFVQDAVPPVTDLTLGVHYIDHSGKIYVTSATDFTLTASDDSSGVAHTYYALNAGPPVEYTGPFELTGANGAYTVSYYSVDNAGNVETAKSITVNLVSLQVESRITSNLFNTVTQFDALFMNQREGGYKLIATIPTRFYNVITVQNKWPINVDQIAVNFSIPADFKLEGPSSIQVFMDYRCITSQCIILGNMVIVNDVPRGSTIWIIISLDYALKGTIWNSALSFGTKYYNFTTAVYGVGGNTWEPGGGLFGIYAASATLTGHARTIRIP